MKMGVCAPLGGQKRFLCEIRGFNSDFGDFFSNIGQSLYEQKHCSVRSRKHLFFKESQRRENCYGRKTVISGVRRKRCLIILVIR